MNKNSNNVEWCRIWQGDTLEQLVLMRLEEPTNIFDRVSRIFG